VKLNFPYYPQTSEFTCGPACVLMVMKHFDPKVRMTRHLEFEVWRKCNMIGIRGADPYGLAVALIDVGLDVRLVTQRRKVIEEKPWRHRLVGHFSREEIELSFYGMRENQRRATERNLPVRYKRPVVADIVDGIRDEFVPVALVHMGVIHHLNIPHWVVVVTAEADRVMFNDPYPPKGRPDLILPRVRFQKILDDIGTRIGMSPSLLFARKR
jgi:hypothetical protein